MYIHFLQLCPISWRALLPRKLGQVNATTPGRRVVHVKWPAVSDAVLKELTLAIMCMCTCGLQDTSKKGEVIRVDAEHLEGVATD